MHLLRALRTNLGIRSHDILQTFLLVPTLTPATQADNTCTTSLLLLSYPQKAPQTHNQPQPL